MTGPTTTGSIDAKLTLDDSDFKRGMAEAKAEAREVAGLNPTVKIDANVGPALAKMAELEAVERGLADTNVRLAATEKIVDREQVQATSSALRLATVEKLLAQAHKDAAEQAAKQTVAEQVSADATDEGSRAATRSIATNNRRVSGLQVLIGLAPAILAAAAPIAAGAVGLGVAFGVMGVSGVLAIKGIKDAMEVGDGVGNQYAAGIGVLKGNLDQLSAVSANHMLASFNTTVGDINTKMPFLNTLVAQNSSLLGQMGGTALAGVLNGLERMNPLIQTGGVELGKFVTWLFSFTNTNGFTEFVNYAVTNLPAVMTLIESLVTTTGHILAAFAPLGPVVVGVLTAISDGLSGLPLPVLAGLVTTATLLSPALKLAGTAMAVFAVESNLAVPVVGILLAAISGLGIMAATAAIGTDTGADSIARYRAELERTNGVIGEGIRNQVAKAVADSDGAAAAKALGISTSDLTAYILDEGDARQRLNGVLSAAAGASSDAAKGLTAYASGARVTTQESQGVLHNVNAIEDLLRSQSGSLGEAKAGWERYQEALKGTSGATAANTAAAQLQAQAYGTTVGMYQTATTAQQTAATQFAQTTANMVQQNDAAGILKQSLDLLNGKAISAAQAQNSFDSSLVNMGDHVSATGKKITFTTTSIGDMSAASVALRGQLNGQVTNLQNVVAANGGLDESTGKAREQMEAMRTQIIDNAVAHGVDKDAVTAYVDNLLKIPATVPPTKLDVDNAQAIANIETFKWHLASIQDRIVTVTERTLKDPVGMGSAESGGGRANGSLAGGVATGGLIHAGFSATSPAYLAGGGTVFAPRGRDTVPAMLEPGEIVMRRASVESIGARTLLRANATGQLPPQQQQHGGGGVHVDQIIINDQHDPVATSMDVQRRLAMIAT